MRVAAIDCGTNSVRLLIADIDGDGREELYVVNCDRITGAKDMADRLFACFGKHWLDLFAQAENAGAANHTAAGAVAALDHHEHGERGRRGAEQPGGLDGVAALGVPGEREGGGGERDREHHRPGYVEDGPVLGPALVQVPAGHRERDDADRHVDEEDPPPVEQVGDDASQKLPGDRAARPHRTPVAEGAVAAVAFPEGRREQGERRGRHHRGADALPGPGRQDLPLGLGEAGGERGEGEGADPDQEQAAPSVQVADPAEDDEQAAEGERVADRDQVQAAVGDGEVGADRRQRHVHHDDVDDQHELGGAQQDEGEPAVMRVRPAAATPAVTGAPAGGGPSPGSCRRRR